MSYITLTSAHNNAKIHIDVEAVAAVIDNSETDMAGAPKSLVLLLGVNDPLGVNELADAIIFGISELKGSGTGGI